MSLDLGIIINNIAAPIVVGAPVRDSDNKIIDFKIRFINDDFKAAAGHVLQDSKTFNGFSPRIVSSVPWFQMAVNTVEGKQLYNETYFSPSTKCYYNIKMNYVKEEDLVVVTFIDITSEREYQKRLKESLITDTLTGLQNRHGFIETFDYIADTSRFENKIFALLIIDIDDLKNVNDSAGVTEGDSLIINVSNILKRFSRDNIHIFRYGDDEFAIIISNLDSVDSVSTFTDTIYEAFQFENISISGGISIFKEHSEQKNELIRFANMALHHSKKNGKNIFTTFDFDMQRVLIQHLTLQTKLTSAILDSNFVMYYQPQFDIKTKELRGFEALIRWEDSELGNIPPSVFIPLAEETGLILPIGNWVLESTIRTLKNWQDKFNFKGIVSINVSPVQLKQENFLENLFTILEKYKVDPNYLEIEITEGIMINNMRATIDKLQVLRSMGLKVSLDDFGTGYSSLSYLQKLPLNTLKIDKSFISNITSNDGVQANITSSIIKMVDNMGLETIAEGVENEDQLHLLKDFNCNIVQGFHSGKPMPLELCNEFLAGDMSALITI
ncbi:MAG: bifunctional diguanylate cyclase/phosphodiesterase [Treponema sp.]|nr:bifunctional diguanylate cyclase/phosphodiesterase [Treponema sp.]